MRRVSVSESFWGQFWPQIKHLASRLFATTVLVIVLNLCIPAQDDGSSPRRLEPSKSSSKKSTEKSKQGKAPQNQGVNTNSSPDNGGWLEKSIDIAIESTKRLVKQIETKGKPMAEMLVKKTPEYYKSIQQSLNEVANKIQKGDYGRTLKEKKEFVLEIWKMRGAINVMALLEPDVLQKLTGVSPERFKIMKVTLNTVENRLSKANLQGI
jgi:hypothetical protein